MAKKKSVASKAFEAAHAGKLSRMGWPDCGKLMAAYKSGKDVMKGLNLLANMSGDPATRAKASACRDRMKKSSGE